jgi:hypothetical protein
MAIRFLCFFKQAGYDKTRFCTIYHMTNRGKYIKKFYIILGNLLLKICLCRCYLQRHINMPTMIISKNICINILQIQDQLIILG